MYMLWKVESKQGTFLCDKSHRGNIHVSRLELKEQVKRSVQRIPLTEENIAFDLVPLNFAKSTANCGSIHDKIMLRAKRKTHLFSVLFAVLTLFVRLLPISVQCYKTKLKRNWENVLSLNLEVFLFFPQTVKELEKMSVIL